MPGIARVLHLLGNVALEQKDRAQARQLFEASLQLSEAVLVDVGVPMGHVIASIHERRDEYRRLLQPIAGAPRRERRAIRLSTRLADAGKRGAAEAKREV